MIDLKLWEPEPVRVVGWVEVDTVCNYCKKPMKTKVYDFFADRCRERGIPVPATHPECQAKRDREREEEEDRKWREDEQRIDSWAIASGLRPDYCLKSPVVPFVHRWLWDHRRSNILLSGETGTGKSTSIGVCVRELIRDERSVQVWYLTGLLDEWRNARCESDIKTATNRLFRRLESTDYLIVDECADNNLNTDSTREFMFRLLEDVQNGSCRAKVWFSGNFYRGAVRDMFGNEPAALRRLQEKFVCGRIDCIRKRIIPIFN